MAIVYHKREFFFDFLFIFDTFFWIILRYFISFICFLFFDFWENHVDELDKERFIELKQTQKMDEIG